jgi:DNA-binding HxlR family transcriptional regulator
MLERHPAEVTPSQPSRAALVVHLLWGRWTFAVLAELAGEGRRYQDLYDALGGISYKVLTDTLRRTERDGLIARRLDGGRIETATLHELTDLGRSLDAPLGEVARWVDDNWQSVEEARGRWDRLR